jgi:hypothetical protein
LTSLVRTEAKGVPDNRAAREGKEEPATRHLRMPSIAIGEPATAVLAERADPAVREEKVAPVERVEFSL